MDIEMFFIGTGAFVILFSLILAALLIRQRKKEKGKLVTL